MTRDDAPPPVGTRRIRLTAAQRGYVADADYLEVDLLDQLGWEAAGGAVAFEITSELAEQFRAEFTLRLAAAGFDEAYEPNDEGLLLEDLIDAFFGRGPT